MARIAIVGVGSIGGALAGHLQSTGNHEIILCTRRPLPQLTARMQQGTLAVQASNFTNPAEPPAVDWVFVATKTYDAEGTAQWFPALCAQGAPVAVFQNGVEHRERFAPYLAEARILPVVIDCPAERPADGIVEVRGRTLTKVGDSPLARDFAALFNGSAATVELVEDFLTAAWWKLCINAPGALCAITRKPTGVLWHPEMTLLSQQIVEECVAVARAEGAQLDASMPQQVTGLYRKHPADSVNSLLADCLAGRSMETQARNGAIVRKGLKHGIATPLNSMVVTLLEAIQNALPTHP